MSRYQGLLDKAAVRKEALEESVKRHSLVREANDLIQWVHDKVSTTPPPLHLFI